MCRSCQAPGWRRQWHTDCERRMLPSASRCEVASSLALCCCFHMPAGPGKRKFLTLYFVFQGLAYSRCPASTHRALQAVADVQYIDVSSCDGGGGRTDMGKCRAIAWADPRPK